MKRSLDVYGDENQYDDFHYDNILKKKQKVQPLRTSNDLGLLSPPVTPEHQNKIINLKNSTLNLVTKKLNLDLLSKSNLTKNIDQISSPYTRAKNLFLRSSTPYSNSNYILNGREKEAAILRSHIMDSLKNLNSSSVYISGPPGTGKSAQVNAIIDSLISKSTIISNDNNSNSQFYNINLDDNNKRKIRIIKVNCMSISNPTELFKDLYNIMTGLKYNTSIGSSQLFNLFKKKNPSDCDMTLLILDELDNIVNKSQQSLFELFTWASNLLENDLKPNLLLIGIANALDLTDRFLPRLRANCINPKLIQFLPYTADQIKSVITGKLLSLIDIDLRNKLLPPLVHPAAIQFCAKKSAVTTGDLRKAFDVMFKSLDLFEINLLKSKSIDELINTPIEKLPKMMISQVVKVCSDSFNSNFELKLKPLNLQQKMILAFLFKYEEKVETEKTQNIKNKSSSKFNQSVSISSFFEYYYEKCKNFDNFITPLKRSEFLEIISSLDTHALVTITMVNTSSSTRALLANSGASLNFDNFKVSSNIPKLEFFKNINDIIILKRIVHSNY